MRKFGQKGITAVHGVIVLIVVIIVGVAAAYIVTRPAEVLPEVVAATATVRLHDAYTVQIADWVENYVKPDLPAGVSIEASGTVTVNSFSATNVKVELHNKDTGEWITIVEGKNIDNMTLGETFVGEISAGTYDNVRVSIGTITVDIEWSDIQVTGTVDPTQFGAPAGTPPISIEFKIDGGSFSGEITIDQTFEISLSVEVSVTEGENQVFDVDVNAPFDLDFSGSVSGLDHRFDVDEAPLDPTHMAASGIED